MKYITIQFENGEISDMIDVSWVTKKGLLRFEDDEGSKVSAKYKIGRNWEWFFGKIVMYSSKYTFDLPSFIESFVSKV